MYPNTDTHLKNLYTLKWIHIQTKWMHKKTSHIFACISVIKTCVTGLGLKDKNAQHWKSFSLSLQIALMSLW